MSCMWQTVCIYWRSAQSFSTKASGTSSVLHQSAATVTTWHDSHKMVNGQGLVDYSQGFVDTNAFLTWPFRKFAMLVDIDGLVQEGRNSIANALELHLSCTNLLISFCYWDETQVLFKHLKYHKVLSNLVSYFELCHTVHKSNTE